MEAKLQDRKLTSHIHRKGKRGKPLTEQAKGNNRTKSKLRVRVEHVFGAQTNDMGGTLVRTIGIARAKAKIGMKNIAASSSCAGSTRAQRDYRVGRRADPTIWQEQTEHDERRTSHRREVTCRQPTFTALRYAPRGAAWPRKQSKIEVLLCLKLSFSTIPLTCCTRVAGLPRATLLLC
jgi:hypothetical protein